MRSTSSCNGDRWQTGSVARASPVRRKAWQRQPPKSSRCFGQERQGSCIQPVPRNALKAGECRQMSASECSVTDQNVETRNHLGRMTRQHLARRRDVERAAAPAAHAGLRIARVIIRQRGIDHDAAVMASCAAHRPSPSHASPARATASARPGSSAPSRNIAHARSRPVARRATAQAPPSRRCARYWRDARRC